MGSGPEPTHEEHRRLKAEVLGRWRLAVDGRAIGDDAWPPRGGRDLLALLLVTGGHRLPRDRVLDALWPDLPPDAARNAYYKALHSLRRVLEPGLAARTGGAFVVTSAESIALDPATIDVDIDAFFARLEHAHEAAADAGIGLLRAALHGWQGELLPDVVVGDWAELYRERVRRIWQDGVCCLADLELAAGGAVESWPMLEAIVSAEPTHEAAQRLLIRAYDRAGQRDLALRQFERCVAALRDEFGVDPSDETRRLGARLLEPEISTPWREARAAYRLHLPVPPTRLIGREDELEELRALLLDSDTRLVTLIGPGGVGKTRLALEAAIQFQDAFRDGACFVPLAPVRDERTVLTTIAHVLGAREELAATPLHHLCQVLSGRQMLMVLDNVEQVLAAAPALAELLASCPDVTMATTSRAPLHLRAERLFDVAPLTLPDSARDAFRLASPAALKRGAAVELFVERAGAVVPGFALDDENAAAVARICARLDGLPLAIELAAARSREARPERLLALLDDRLGTLVDGFHDLPLRQRTMRDTIAWSYDLLAEDEQSLFRRMAVCAGGCTPELVSRMTGLAKSDAAQRLALLASKSLIRWQDDGDRGRTAMLETTREFGLDRLAALGELHEAQDALVAYLLDVVVEAADRLSGPEQADWLDRLDAEHDNVREVFSWTIERGEAERALTLGGALWRFWWSRGYLTEGREWLARALVLPGGSGPAVRGAAINGAASLAESQGDFTAAAALHTAALDIWRHVGSLSGEARALSGLGTAAAHRGDYDVARGYHERALHLVRQTADAPGTARTLDRLGTLARHQGDLHRAEDCYGESLEIFRTAGDLVNVSIVLSNLGEVAHQQGCTERAAEFFEEALRLERELDLPDGIAFDLTNLARVRLDLGEVERAAALSAQAVRLFRDLGNQLGLAGALAVFGMTARARGEPERTVHYLGEGLRILAELDERSAIPEHLEMLAGALLDARQAGRAVRLIGAAEALRAAIASPPSAVDLAAIQTTLDGASAELGAGKVAAALETGRGMGLDLAMAEASQGAKDVAGKSPMSPALI